VKVRKKFGKGRWCKFNRRTLYNTMLGSNCFWLDALTFQDGPAAVVVKRSDPWIPHPDWLTGYAKKLFPDDWQGRIENLTQPPKESVTGLVA